MPIKFHLIQTKVWLPFVQMQTALKAKNRGKNVHKTEKSDSSVGTCDLLYTLYKKGPIVF